MKNGLLIFLLFMIVGCKQKNPKMEGAYSSKQLKEDNCLALNSSLCKPVHLSNSISPFDTVAVKQLIAIKNCQVVEWISPFANGRLGEGKMVACFRQTGNIQQLLIANVLEFFDFSDEKYFDMEQYMIAINKVSGKVVDGFKVQGNISGDSLGDSIIVGKGKILNIKINSRFESDSIIYTTYNYTFINPPESHNEADLQEDVRVEKRAIQFDGYYKLIEVQ